MLLTHAGPGGEAVLMLPNVVPNCSCPTGFCASDSAQVLLLLFPRLAHILGIGNIPASHITSDLDLLTQRRKRTAMSMNKFLPGKTLFIHFLVLSRQKVIFL